MRSLSFAATFLMVGLISACGGGGGSAGTSSGLPSSPTPIPTVTDTRLSVSLRDAANVEAPSVPASGGGQLVAVLVDSSGAPVANQTIKVTVPGNLVTFPNGNAASTDAAGVAKIKVNRRTNSAFGIASVNVSFSPSICSTVAAVPCFAGSSITSDFRVSPPSFKLELIDPAGSATSAVSPQGFTSLKATLKFDDGTPVVQKRVDVTGDPVKVSFPEGSSALTSSVGEAIVKVARASQTSNGAGTLLVSSSISGTSAEGGTDTVVTGSLDYNLGLSQGVDKLTLSGLDVGTSALLAYGTRQISVQANLGIVPSTAPVVVAFTSSCGQVLPSSATTNSAGIALVSFTATDAPGTVPSTLGCSGKSVEISASAVGAEGTVRKSLSILSAPATNLSFVVPIDQSKLRIYLDGSGGLTQTLVQFLLTNAIGEAIPSQDVLISLKTLNGGIPKATFGTKGNVAPVSLITDATGKVSVPVFSGTVPTNVLVNAVLVSNAAVQTDSSIVTIASGRPTQNRVSLSLGKLSIPGFNVDGEETTVTMSLADRQGNPVPDGTAVNFVSEGGVLIPPICVTGGVAGDSRCTVKIRSQNPRPVNGRVSILAYSAGEEEFVDANFDNIYNCGESFTDLGTAFRSDGALTAGAPLGSSYTTGAFAVPRSGSQSTCSASSTPTPTAGDGVWGGADVRQQTVLIFATDEVRATLSAATASKIELMISDANNNSIPTGSGLVVSVTDASPNSPITVVSPTVSIIGSCTLVGISADKIPNQLDPFKLIVNLKDCAAEDQVKLTVTTPGSVNTFTFTVP